MPPLAPTGEGHGEQSWGFARAEHLLELQAYVERHPLAPTERIVAWAGTLLEKEARVLSLLEERERKKRRRTKEGGGERSLSPAVTPPDKPVDTPEKAVEAPDPEPFVLVIPKRAAQGFSTNDLLRSSPVAQSTIIRSTSSKLNYILNEVCLPTPSSRSNPDTF